MYFHVDLFLSNSFQMKLFTFRKTVRIFVMTFLSVYKSRHERHSHDVSNSCDLRGYVHCIHWRIVLISEPNRIDAATV